MDALAAEFVAIRKLCDRESVHVLLLDCWTVAVERGEAEGLLWAGMVRRGVEAVLAHEAAAKRYMGWAKPGEGE